MLKCHHLLKDLQTWTGSIQPQCIQQLKQKFWKCKHDEKYENFVPIQYQFNHQNVEIHYKIVQSNTDCYWLNESLMKRFRDM